MGRGLQRSDSFRHVALVSNSSSLVPVGVLRVYGLPNGKTDLGGLAAIMAGKLFTSWKWLDLDMLPEEILSKMSPLMEKLWFLIHFRFFMATYKIVPNIKVAVIRLYAVPDDVKGSKHIREWRLSFPKYMNIERKRSEYWHDLVEVLDYSDSGWNSKTFETMLLFPFFGKYFKSKDNPSHSRYHIDRWINNKPYSKNEVNEMHESYVARVQKIYNSMVSPDLSWYLNKTLTNNSVTTAEEVMHNLALGTPGINVPGVKSHLYSFQVTTLGKMYEKEVAPTRMLFPNLIKLRSPGSDSPYYFDVLHSKLYLEPELYLLPSGGILAENMGLGKTLICLSLVCLTKCEISVAPDDMMLYEEPEPAHGSTFIKTHPRVPKLAELCQVLINQNSLPWKYYADDLPSSVVQRLISSPGYFRVSLDHFQDQSQYSLKTRKVSDRRKVLESTLPEEGKNYRTLLLCNTTLTVVPDNLFHQWVTELKKHVDPTFLTKLFVSNQFKRPYETEHAYYTNVLTDNPNDIINYDLVIVTQSLLSRQFDKLYSDSPLMKIYWKRLIIDEGHSINSKTSRISLLCKNLYSERRWAVTGTPTSGLTKLDMDEEQADLDEPVSPKKKKYVVQNTFNAKDDLAKLGVIVSNFLKIEPFHSQHKLWTNAIIAPFIANSYGSKVALSNILNSITVRHNLLDVEKDVKLPQLHHEPVFLLPSYHNKLSINLFTAVLAVNAVSSDRTDMDYMFHPANRQQLRTLITNLQRATFHWSGFKQQDVETLVHICNLCLEKKKANGAPYYSPYDISLLEKSIEAAERALANPRWRSVALLHEMPYFVSNLPDIFTKNFGIGVVESVDQQGVQNDIGVFGATHLNTIQEFFYKNRFMDMNDVDRVREKLEFAAKPFWESYWRDTIKKNSEKYNKQDKNQDFRSEIKSEDISDAIKEPKVIERHRERLMFSKHKNGSFPPDLKQELTRDVGEGLRYTDDVKTSTTLDRHNISYESIRRAMILGTASAKLSYLGARLLEHQADNIKSVVFFEFEDSAYYLTELLDVLGVNYILYATFINPSQRASNLSEFSNEEGGVSLIMDLRLAAHGLTILAATRVYFISPVWQRSIEAQAIKRTHRIGQTKEIYVETLVLRDTLEEEIYKKRSVPTDVNKADQKYVIDDSGMQEFVLRHQFLKHDSETEYEIFKTQANTFSGVREANMVLNDEYSLSTHEIVTNGFQNLWKVYLFNENNLEKLNKTKNQKIFKEHAREEFIKGIVNDQQEVKKKRLFKLNPHNRKRVKF